MHGREKAGGGPPPAASRVVDGLLVPAPGRLVGDLLAWFAGTARRPNGEPLHVLPAEGADIDVWVLETVAAHREAFRPSAHLDRPHVMVSADVVVADSDDRARELAAPYGQRVLDIRAGRGARSYVTPEQARSRPWTDEERAAVRDRVDTQFAGSPASVVERLRTLARVTGADELLVTTITTDHAARVRSTELLAEAWNRAAVAA